MYFSVTARGIYFFVGNFFNRTEGLLRFFDFGSQRVTPVVTVDARVVGGVTVSSDERMILFSQRDQIASDLILVNGINK